MNTFIESLEWFMYNQIVLVIGGLVCLTVAIYYAVVSSRAYKQGFEIEGIRYAIVSIEWLLMFIWFKL